MKKCLTGNFFFALVSSVRSSGLVSGFQNTLYVSLLAVRNGTKFSVIPGMLRHDFRWCRMRRDGLVTSPEGSYTVFCVFRYLLEKELGNRRPFPSCIFPGDLSRNGRLLPMSARHSNQTHPTPSQPATMQNQRSSSAHCTYTRTNGGETGGRAVKRERLARGVVERTLHPEPAWIELYTS